MYYGYNDTRTDREKQLEYELEDARRDAERERERREQERESRMEEYRERAQWNERHADSWLEAFRKAEHLFSREIDPEYEKTDGDFYFTDSAEACRVASGLWTERSQAHADEIKELETKIQQIQDQIREEVADLLEEKAPKRGDKPSYGFRGVATSIREGDTSSLLDW